MREQKHHVDRTGGDKSGDQHGVHHGLQNRPQSMNETQVKSPKVCFRRIHLSFTESDAILGATFHTPTGRAWVSLPTKAERSIKAMIDPKDIAVLAVFLASGGAKSISGQVLPIDNDRKRA
jgi:NAD(P)-dependent dehydrogenase (short-subunit alcohol dehydrogenase family)